MTIRCSPFVQMQRMRHFGCGDSVESQDIPLLPEQEEALTMPPRCSDIVSILVFTT